MREGRGGSRGKREFERELCVVSSLCVHVSTYTLPSLPVARERCPPNTACPSD